MGVTLAGDPEFPKAQFCYRTSIHSGWRLGSLEHLALALLEPMVSWHGQMEQLLVV